MRKRAIGKHLRHGAVVTTTILGLVGSQSGMAQPAPNAAPSEGAQPAPPSSAAQAATKDGPFGPNSRDDVTATPIKHVIIIIGENRTFDNVFATYVPKAGETVWNLLSEGIVKPDGTPGPNYSKSLQDSGSDYNSYQLAPPKTPYQTLPAFQVGGPYTPYGCQLIGIDNGSTTNCNTPANIVAVTPYENGLAPDYYQYLLTGGTGQTSGVPDARVYYDGEDASNLPSGPFQLTQSVHSPTFPYDAYSASPVHRLFQMWQELDCSAKKATKTDRRAAARIFSRGSRPPSAPAPTARRSPRAIRAKARLLCFFSMSRRATRPI